MIKAIIIEDNPYHADDLVELLSKTNTSIHILAVCSDVASAFDAITKHKPDLVFLDIQLQGELGFDLLSKFKEIKFEVIFISVHAVSNSLLKAISAIKACEVELLKKPIKLYELNRIMSRIQNSESESVNRINKVIVNINSIRNRFFVLKIDKRFVSIKFDDLIYCEGDNNYTIFHFSIPIESSRTHRKAITLKVLENERFANSTMYRSHDSYIVNLKHIKNINRKQGKVTITLSNDIELDVSGSKKKDFLKVYSQFKKNTEY